MPLFLNNTMTNLIREQQEAALDIPDADRLHPLSRGKEQTATPTGFFQREKNATLSTTLTSSEERCRGRGKAWEWDLFQEALRKNENIT